jgi:hypothetical protein
MDTRGQLQQSAKDLRALADKEKVSLTKVQQQRDQLKATIVNNRTVATGGGEQQIVSQLDRQLKDMQKEIDRLEFQARDMDRQSRAF